MMAGQPGGATGMDIQEALDAPTVYSAHFSSSFYPRQAFPGRMVVERRIPKKTVAALLSRGHEVFVIDGWENGKVMGIRYDKARGVISGAASPRTMIGYALGW